MPPQVSATTPIPVDSHLETCGNNYQMEDQTVVSGQLEDSLRHEIESYIEGRLSGVKQEIAALQSQLNESLTRLLDRQSEVQLDGGLVASIQEHLHAAHNEGINLAATQSSRAKASTDMAIVKAAIDEIDEQKTQSDILKVLIGRAAAFAPRIAFFVIKGDQSIGWRARGFEGTVGDQVIHEISFPVSADTALGHSARTRQTWSGGPGSHNEDHLFLNRFGDEPPQRIVGVPLVVRDRSVAVLYADSAELDADSINLEALETLSRVAGMAVELLAARSAPARQVEAPAPPVEEAPPAYTPTAEYEEAAPVAEESAPSPEPVYTESAPEPTFAEPQTAPPPVEAAPAVEAQPEAAAPPRRRYGADVELPVEVSNDEERRLHNDARRFARLLVSEIKLYNEGQVVEGRSQNDLYPRLREYIDRSREMYDKRVKAEVAQRYDYFHHELVNTLAEGDERKLGAAYPGATVSA